MAEKASGSRPSKGKKMLIEEIEEEEEGQEEEMEECGESESDPRHNNTISCFTLRLQTMTLCI